MGKPEPIESRKLICPKAECCNGDDPNLILWIKRTVQTYWYLCLTEVDTSGSRRGTRG